MKDISAFPTPAHNLTNDGMTLRDYFAAKAMPEFIGFSSPESGAKSAYEWADAMLKARNAAQ
jgi:hypothetical protein